MRKKLKILTAAMILLFSLMSSVFLLSTTSAHSPTWSIPTYAYINVAPNPVGVGQSAYIYMWLDKVIDGASLANDIRFHGYQLTITAPNGQKTVQSWSVVWDPTSSQGYSFTPDQTGTYTLNFTYPGQVYTFTEPISSFFGPPSPSQYINDTYEASSATITLTVQSTAIATIPATPLPTQYWTRPIYGENSNWYTVSSNWLGSGAPGYGLSGGMFLPDSVYSSDTVGSQTSHIMWTEPLQSGGVVGGNKTVIQGDTYFEGSAYNSRYTNPIILDGKLYYTAPLSFAGGNNGETYCVNLQTGQQIWSSTTIPALSFGYIYDVQDPNQHGVYPPLLVATSGSTWRVFDADTSVALFNVTNVPSGTTLLGPEGEHLILTLTNDGTPAAPLYYLAEWNSSRLWDDQYSGSSTTPQVVPPILNGATLSLYDWNVSVPSLNTQSAMPSILAAFTGNLLIGMLGSYPGPASVFTQQSSAPYTYFALNLNPATTIGTLLWSKTYDPPAGNITVSFGGADPTVNVFVEYYRETMQWVGYSMATGEKLWGPVGDSTGLAFYNFDSVPTGQNSQVAYGKLYSTGFGGLIDCYDLKTGELLWTYGNGEAGNSTNAGLATPHGYYPMVIYAIGNGIIYTVTSEHDVETPIYKGALTRAINATTGQEIFTLSDDNNGGSGAAADGYNTFFNGYDNQIYVIGKGPSVTTVTAPDVGLTFGQSVVIRGTVMDISAGTKQDEQASDFANGVPCASDASMSAWMSYVYQQQPEPTDFKGVPVTISVLDSNGNSRVIGSATTNDMGIYTLTWTPDIPGNYTVTATFAGTNGYWSSSDATSFTVMQPTQATASPTTTPTSIADTYFVPAIAGIFVLIIVVAVALALLILRKRP